MIALIIVLGVLGFYSAVGVLDYRATWIKQAKEIRRGKAPGWKSLKHWSACQTTWGANYDNFKNCTCSFSGKNMAFFGPGQKRVRNAAGFWRPGLLAFIWPLRFTAALAKGAGRLASYTGLTAPFKTLAAWFHPELQIPDAQEISKLERELL